MKKSLDSLSPIDIKPKMNNSYANNEAYYNYGGPNGRPYNLPLKRIGPTKTASVPRKSYHLTSHNIMIQGTPDKNGKVRPELAPMAIQNPPWAISADYEYKPKALDQEEQEELYQSTKERYAKAYDDKMRRKSKSVLRTIPKKFDKGLNGSRNHQYSGTDLQQSARKELDMMH